MWAATLIVCLVPLGTVDKQCTPFQDTRGPYETETACLARAEEMSGQFDVILKVQGFRGSASFRGFCKPDKVEQSI